MMMEQCTVFHDEMQGEIRKRVPSAKEILRAIKNKAAARRTYYVILEYWSGMHSVCWEQRLADEMGCTSEVWNEVVKLHRRYSRFCHYITEIKPEWREVSRIHWADNSVESVQQDRHGNTRKVMIVPPHGDLC